LENQNFSHVDSNNQPTMVDIGDKKSTQRYAKAQSTVIAPHEVMKHFKDGEISTKKGPVFQTAIIAGTMAVKRTHEFIPFCHPLPIESCKIKIRVHENNKIIIECETSTHHKTGIEMEALCGASIAALTIYDMCKALSHKIRIENTELIEKTGGKSDYKKII